MTVEQLAKIDAPKVMLDDEAFHALIHCEVGQLCSRCFYRQLPPPPKSIILPHNGYADAKQAAYYAANEPAHERTTTNVQVDGPKSCKLYWESCFCAKCNARDCWYVSMAT